MSDSWARLLDLAKAIGLTKVACALILGCLLSIAITLTLHLLPTWIQQANDVGGGIILTLLLFAIAWVVVDLLDRLRTLVATAWMRWITERDDRKRAQAAKERERDRFSSLSPGERAVLRVYIEEGTKEFQWDHMKRQVTSLGGCDTDVERLVERQFLRAQEWPGCVVYHLYDEHFRTLSLNPDLVGAKAPVRQFGFDD